MEAYGKLVAAVSAALDEFLDDATTHNRMRDHLVDQYPDLFGAAEATVTRKRATWGLQMS